MVPWVMYAQGNIEFLSEEWLQVVKHAVREAARLDMEVAITFSPGWCFGGFWVPPTERSKMLTRAWVDVSGPGAFSQPLPAYVPAASAAVREDLPESFPSDAPDEDSVVAVVAGEVAGSGLNGNTLIDLSQPGRPKSFGLANSCRPMAPDGLPPEVHGAAKLDNREFYPASMGGRSLQPEGGDGTIVITWEVSFIKLLGKSSARPWTACSATASKSAFLPTRFTGATRCWNNSRPTRATT